MLKSSTVQNKCLKDLSSATSTSSWINWNYFLFDFLDCTFCRYFPLEFFSHLLKMWSNPIKSVVQQVSVFVPLLFLISTSCKIWLMTRIYFLLSTSSFRCLIDGVMNQWKIKLNLDPNKQAQEARFANITNKDRSLSLTFNSSKVETISSQKHLGLILDEQLNLAWFRERLN